MLEATKREEGRQLTRQPSSIDWIMTFNLLWKDIPGHSGYQVSNDGQVRSLPRSILCSNGVTITWKGRTLKPVLDGTGYPRVTLRRRKRKKVHRLVAEAFLPSPKVPMDIDHIDRDRTNNRVENLRWATRRQNLLNSSLRSNNKSGVHGVYYDKARGKWAVQGTRFGKVYCLGRFDFFDDACDTRKAWEKQDPDYEQFVLNNSRDSDSPPCWKRPKENAEICQPSDEKRS